MASEPKARPILMHARSIENLLGGRKTQTRRIVKPQPGDDLLWYPRGLTNPLKPLRRVTASDCPYGLPGDLLWVREATTYWERPDMPAKEQQPRANESHRPSDGARYERWMNRVTQREMPGEDFLVYKADGAKRSLGEWKHPHPIYEHCVGRFGKTVVPIHMPRWASRLTLVLTDVRVERVMAISESDAEAEGADRGKGFAIPCCYRHGFGELWEHTNGPGAWARNDWVWALTFEVLRENVDAVLATPACV